MRSLYPLSVLLLALVVPSAFAQTGSYWNEAANRWVDVTFGDGYKVTNIANSTFELNPRSGVAVPSAVAPLTNSGSLAVVKGPAIQQLILQNDPSGDIVAVGKARLATSGTNVVDAVVKGSIPKASVAAAIGRFAGSTLLPALGVGVGLYELAKELGYTASNLPDGSAKFEKGGQALYFNVPGYPSGLGESGGCAAYNPLAVPEGTPAKCRMPQVWYPQDAKFAANVDKAAACAAWGKSGGYGAWLAVGGTYCELSTGYQRVMNTTGSYLSETMVKTVGGGPSVEATRQAFVDAVAAKSGWPSTSNLARTLAAAVASGQAVDLVPRSISGPAETPEKEVSKVTDSATGNTTTTKEKQKITYAPSPVPYSPTTGTPSANPGPMAPTSWSAPSPSTSGVTDSPTATVTNITNTTVTNITNNTTNNTTTEAAPKPADDPVTDSPLGDVPKLYTPKYPDGLTGVWNTKKAELSGSSLAGLTAVLLPPMAESGGVCPVWNLDLSLASWANYGVKDVAPPCWIWAFAKTVIILSALLLARALVFGG